MPPERNIIPDLPDCERECDNRFLRKIKITTNNYCTEELAVAKVTQQVVRCETCMEEFSYPIGAKEH